VGHERPPDSFENLNFLLATYVSERKSGLYFLIFIILLRIQDKLQLLLFFLAIDI